MTPRATFCFFAALSLALPSLTTRAQMPYSPASPPNTSGGFGGLSPSRLAPATRPAQAQPGMPVTGLATVNGGYVTNTQVMTSEPIDPNHKLGRGDVLSYRVEEDREELGKSYDLVVSDSGEVNLPLGGLVKAAGKTTLQLSGDVKSRLEAEYYKRATVSMGLKAVAQRASRGRVNVAGAVRSIGAVELPVDAPMTASQAVYQVGGLVDFSAPEKAYVLRGDTKLLVNLKKVENGDASKDIVLQPGDKVIVPEAKIKVSIF